MTTEFSLKDFFIILWSLYSQTMYKEILIVIEPAKYHYQNNSDVYKLLFAWIHQISINVFLLYFLPYKLKWIFRIFMCVAIQSRNSYIIIRNSCKHCYFHVLFQIVAILTNKLSKAVISGWYYSIIKLFHLCKNIFLYFVELE